MGRSLGKGMREFKDSISGKDDDDEPVHHRLAQELPPADEHPVAQQQQARERDSLLASGGDMALKRLPRRLQHGEEATLVEHLGELRSAAPDQPARARRPPSPSRSRFSER